MKLWVDVQYKKYNKPGIPRNGQLKQGLKTPSQSKPNFLV